MPEGEAEGPTIKYLLFAGVSAGVLADVVAEGDEAAIPEHFLAFEGKACKRQATELAGATIAESYCNCVTEGIAARYSFKGYILRNAAMTWEAWREGIPVELIAGRDPALRDLYHCSLVSIAQRAAIGGEAACQARQLARA